MIEMQDINDNIINQIEFIFIDGKNCQIILSKSNN